MKALLTSVAVVAFTASAALAQSGAQQTQQRTTPTCQQALPQIENLVDQADQAGLNTATAETHVDSAREARSSGEERACIEALVMAQNDILKRADAQRQQQGGTTN
ncbi:hypothetical protein [Amorphus orientalis]|uniref:Uncharacterized protein n=1 Tax=Amorphus orientalis TaxID=649198 RepID=A0AAE3VL52_9HYPH|nr:hypothetical protein [Amorphus orientalis]MDQ0314514.1 hypothetical protein [Amorphus orientalis]